jgi:hypothetical protein
MPSPLRGLQVVDALGVFYRENDGTLMVADEFEGTRDVEAILAKFLGEQVQILAHHRPVEPHDLARWGGGCCLFERAGHCPYGHHDTPQRLFAVQANGKLEHTDAWSVVKEDQSTDLHLNFLVGHRAQLLVLRPPELEGINTRIDSLQEEPLEKMSLEELSSKLRATRDLLEEVNRLKDKIDV